MTCLLSWTINKWLNIKLQRINRLMKRIDNRFRGLKINHKARETTKWTKPQQLLFKLKISYHQKMEPWVRLKLLAIMQLKKHFQTHQQKKIPSNYHKNFKTIRKFKLQTKINLLLQTKPKNCLKMMTDIYRAMPLQE